MKIKDLSPNPNNPRTITPAKLEMLKKSLAEFGDLGGFVFNRKTKRLVGGHQRGQAFPPNSQIVIEKAYKKATKTGTVAEGFVNLDGERFKYREVDWAANREKAANIAANKGAGEWDMPKLAEWVSDLGAVNFDLDLTMFDEKERAELESIHVSAHDRSKEGLTDDDEVPVKVPARVKLGEIYELGAHRLMCGDSTVKENVERLMAGEKADMVFTDPPYGISLKRGDYQRAAKGKFHGKELLGDESVEAAKMAHALCTEMQIPSMIFWGANYFASTLPDQKAWIVWDKQTVGDVYADCEMAWTNQTGRVRKFSHQWHGMIKASERGEQRVHPTQKPVALAEWCFENYGKVGQSVLDLFGGSGSTLIACEKTDRRCFMMELDPHYCDVIIERWEKFTGNTARIVKAKTKRNGTDSKATRKS